MDELRQKIGSSKAGRRFIAQMRLYNDSDFRRLRGFMRSGYYDLALLQNPVERRLLDMKAARKLHGRLKVAEIESVKDYAIQLIMLGEKGLRLRLRLSVTESYPHLVTEYWLLPLMERCDDQ
ncbi:MAG: hypothetical protein OXG92_11220 [Chloroflexi bacterium]|nr:hypothetical protein [Chloroflexota bacterium]MCY3581630.1 hypothetical protein [Chloroflexota bacterium]MCY3717024.1 hypothetical protein [Chloroflexota bacterium]MDE2652155.1 hypothetical protein [Chloroflexota bacterium]MXV92089.1 hypothetical protein [Chloroflexota bacterium]